MARKLTDEEKKSLTEILQNLTIERSKIKFTMGYCYDHAEAAEDVCTLFILMKMIDDSHYRLLI